MFQVGQNTKGYHISGRQQVQTSTGKHTQGSDAGRRRVVRPGATEVQGLGFRLVGKGFRGSDVWKRGFRVCGGSFSRPRFSSPSSFSSGTAELQGLGWKARDSEAARSSPSVLRSPALHPPPAVPCVSREPRALSCNQVLITIPVVFNIFESSSRGRVGVEGRRSGGTRGESVSGGARGELVKR